MMEESKLTAIRRDIYINVSPQRVWQALVNSEERNCWETLECHMDVRVGGECSFNVGWGVSWSTKIVELIEQKKMVFANEDGGLTIWELMPEGDGTRVSVEYRGLWIGDQGHMIAENMMFGTYQFMRNLKSVLEEQKDNRHSFWRSWLGISYTSIREDHKGQYSLSKGSLVIGVSKNLPIFDQVQVGDVITEVNGEEIIGYFDLEDTVAKYSPGDLINIKLNRNGKYEQEAILVHPYPAT